jgi:hypothetical protein
MRQRPVRKESLDGSDGTAVADTMVRSRGGTYAALEEGGGFVERRVIPRFRLQSSCRSTGQHVTTRESVLGGKLSNHIYPVPLPSSPEVGLIRS